jgi:uncharacterized protein (DUF302 family)
MKKVAIKPSVADAIQQIKTSLQQKGFDIFCDIDHQANAKSIDFELAASHVLIFGNPLAGTKLMQRDIMLGFDLPLRLAVVEKDGTTILIHQTIDDFTSKDLLDGHPVLGKIEQLFSSLAKALGA